MAIHNFYMGIKISVDIDLKLSMKKNGYPYRHPLKRIDIHVDVHALILRLGKPSGAISKRARGHLPA